MSLPLADERATHLVTAAAAGILSGLACASSPPVEQATDAAPPEEPSQGQTVEIALPPAGSAPPVVLTAAERAEPPPTPIGQKVRECCKGMNECKGKGMCKTERHDCKGLNECKGLGGCKPMEC